MELVVGWNSILKGCVSMAEMITKEKLRENLQFALQAWGAWDQEENPLSSLRLVKRRLEDNPDSLFPLQAAVNEVILNAIQELNQIEPHLAEVLRMRFIEGETRDIVSRRLMISDSTLGRYQRQAIDHLATVMYKMEKQASESSTEIKRSIEIPPKYKQAFVSLMSFFADHIDKQYPDRNVGVTIEQQGTLVTLTISTPEGERERIERKLDDLGLVVQGKMSPVEYFSNPLDILALKQKLEIMSLELRLTRETQQIERQFHQGHVDSLERQIQWVGSLLVDSQAVQRELMGTLRALAAQATQSTSDSFDTILEILDRGITVQDAEELARSLETIKRHDKSLFQQLSEMITEGAIQGVVGNYLYQVLLEVGLRLP